MCVERASRMLCPSAKESEEARLLHSLSRSRLPWGGGAEGSESHHCQPRSSGHTGGGQHVNPRHRRGLGGSWSLVPALPPSETVAAPPALAEDVSLWPLTTWTPAHRSPFLSKTLVTGFRANAVIQDDFSPKLQSPGKMLFCVHRFWVDVNSGGHRCTHLGGAVRAWP